MNPADIIDAIVHTVLDWVLGLRGVTAIAAVAGMAFVETALFIGLVIPGETAMAIAGVIAARHDIPLGAMIAAGAAGAIAGDSISYWVARSAGLGLVRRHPWMARRVGPRLRGANRFFHRHGPRAILFGRWIGWLRSMLPFVAGLGEMPFGRFLLWAVVAGISWVVTIVTLGYVLGDLFVDALATYSTPIVVGFLLLLVAIWLVRRRGVGRQPTGGS